MKFIAIIQNLAECIFTMTIPIAIGMLNFFEPTVCEIEKASEPAKTPLIGKELKNPPKSQ